MPISIQVLDKTVLVLSQLAVIIVLVQHSVLVLSSDNLALLVHVCMCGGVSISLTL